MATYSHSRISTFENCPYQYKLKYIDKKKPEIINTIEAFMGDIVHRTLEKLYTDKKFRKRVDLASLQKFFKKTWEKEYSEDILIVKKEYNEKHYRKMGLQFIKDYYNKYKPFNQLNILGLETQDKLTLQDGNQWHIRIDKLACDDKGNYYVCDYKTNSNMKMQEDADSDRQLAMYSIWVRDKFSDAKSVKLIWHMLAFNKEVVSERTEKQLIRLQKDIMKIIQEIKKAEEKDLFPRNQTALCDYCGFKSQCPSFKHLYEIEKLLVKEFKQEDGVKLVDEFAKIKKQMSELKKQEDELKLNLIEFAKQNKLDVIYGSNMKTSVKDLKKIILPENKEDKERLIKLLKKKGLWKEFEMLNYSRFNSLGRKGELDKTIMKKVGVGEDWRVSLSKRRDLGEG